MRPVEPPGEGKLVLLTAEDQALSIEAVPARIREDGAIVTTWQLSREERHALLDGAHIELVLPEGNDPLRRTRLRVQGLQGPSGLDDLIEDG